MTLVLAVVNITSQMPGTSRNSTDRRRRTRRRGRVTTWKLLTPTVLWTIAVLAMTPSLHGFGVARIPPVGRSRGVAAGGGGFAYATHEAAPAGLPTGAAGVGSTGRGQQGGSWLKERVRDGRRRLHMQVSGFDTCFGIVVVVLILQCMCNIRTSLIREMCHNDARGDGRLCRCCQVVYARMMYSIYNQWLPEQTVGGF